jgi:hypothetical protein
VTKTPDRTNVCIGANTSVTYTYVVTNSGSAALTVNLADDILGDIDGGAGVNLAAGASQTFTKSSAINATTTNIVTATGTSAGGQTATATATATVTAFNCTITVTKTPRQTQVCNGSTVTYDYTVTNNSTQFTWSGTFVDNVLGNIGTQPVVLAPGASVNRSLNGVVTGEVNNTATATGTFNDVAATAAADSDSATVTGYVCNITVTKVPRQTRVCNGATVAYDYTVTNNSPQFTWSGTFVDNVLGNIGTQPVVLAPGASVNRSLNGVITGVVNNTATATGAFNDFLVDGRCRQRQRDRNWKCL